MDGIVPYLVIALVTLVLGALAMHISRAWWKLARAEREAKAESRQLVARVEKLLPEAKQAVEDPATLAADRELFAQKQIRFAELCVQMDGGRRPLLWDTIRRELGDIHWRLRMLRAPRTSRGPVAPEPPPGS